MPLGNPIRKQNESRMVSVLATEGQTVFTVQGGYIINQLSVFRNGVRLSNAEDFTAGDGSTVTLNNAANIDDRIEFHIFDRFTVQNAIIGAASTQTINGDLVLNGKLFGQLDVPSINLTGIITATELDLNGKGDISGDLNVAGVSTFAGNINANGNIVGDDSTNISGISSVTATTFYGSGSNLTGIDATTIKDGGGTVRVQGNTSGIVVTGVSTFSGAINGTLATAAQANVTSVGTLTGLTVSADSTINGVTVGKGANSVAANTCLLYTSDAADE